MLTKIHLGALACVLGLAGTAMLAQPALAEPEDPNTTCTVQPQDPVDGSFRTGGFGTPQVRANRALVKASDNATFAIVCTSVDSAPFTVSIEYGFQYRPEPGTWVDLGPELSCSQTSVGAGRLGVVVLAGPPGSCPDPRIVFGEDDPTLGLPHLFRLSLTTSDGVVIQGVSNPWTHEKVG